MRVVEHEELRPLQLTVDEARGLFSKFSSLDIRGKAVLSVEIATSQFVEVYSMEASSIRRAIRHLELALNSDPEIEQESFTIHVMIGGYSTPVKLTIHKR